jgi:hypothetical protein
MARRLWVSVASWQLRVSMFWDRRLPVRTLAEDNVGIRYQPTVSEDIEDVACGVVRSEERELMTAL